MSYIHVTEGSVCTLLKEKKVIYVHSKSEEIDVMYILEFLFQSLIFNNRLGKDKANTKIISK